MEDKIYNMMQYLEQVLSDLGVPSAIRDSLIEIFLGDNSYSMGIGDYNITYNGNAFIIKNNMTGNYIVFNKNCGLMINYVEDNKKYYLEMHSADNYSMQINTDIGISHVEWYERRPKKCRYSLSEGVYTYSEIKVDSGTDEDRELLISCVEDSNVVNDFKNRFMSPLEETFPFLRRNELIYRTKSNNKVYCKEKETNI